MKPPKSKFLEDKAACNFHADLVMSDAFVKAINTALLQMSFLTTNANGDMNRAVAAHYMHQGALEFVRILLTLADPPRPPAPKEADNLNWKT
jgi:hypothetical protein